MDQSPLRSRPAVVGLEALTAGANGTHAIHTNGSHATHTPHGRPWKVAAIVPCFNRRSDLVLLLKDVARQDLRPVKGRPIQLWLTVVDNASTDPLSTISIPDGLTVEFVRLEKNTGGSGGFNAGMSHVLSGAGLTAELGQPDFLWWLDSDARAGRKCLRELVKVLARHPRVGGVGSALGDIPTGDTWETGAKITRKNGYIKPCRPTDKRFPNEADYLAACSGLVRRTAVERTGLFPENFIYYDDIDWCIQMTAKTGLKIVGAPKSRAYHPPGNRRYVTWGRYYIARNCFSHMDVMKLGNWTRFKRALRELPRAVGQAMMGLEELAELHIKGLADAKAKNFPKIEPRDLVKPLGFKPFKDIQQVIDAAKAELQKEGISSPNLWVHPLLKSKIPGLEAFRRELRRVKFEWPTERSVWRNRALEGHLWKDFVEAAWRGLTSPTADVAIVPTGWPTSWFRGRILIQVTTEGLLVRRVRPMRQAVKAASIAWRGFGLAVGIGLRGPHTMQLPPAPAFRPVLKPVPAEEHIPTEVVPQAIPAAVG
ncbi:MAG TPA: glycosyltransferase family 2 protein [Phycisphaerales bacterium]|nr:glycosyltransferase family 2 protein [Phycisphaerales bacterium]